MSPTGQRRVAVVGSGVAGLTAAYVAAAGGADVVVSREGNAFKVDCAVLLASGQQLTTHGVGGDAHMAFDAALQKIAEAGFDPVYGARPLKRVIQKRLVDRLALAILEGEFTEGDLVRVDAADGELVFERAEAAAAATA